MKNLSIPVKYYTEHCTLDILSLDFYPFSYHVHFLQLRAFEFPINT